MTAHTSSLYRNLYFTLGTPLAALPVNEGISICDLWRLKSSSVCDTNFSGTFKRNIQEITFWKEIYFSEQSNFFLRGVASYLLPGKIEQYLTEFLRYASASQLKLAEVQTLYALAEDLKRHESKRSVLWNALSKTHQLFLHQLTLWSEDLHVLQEPIHYQWLGDGRFNRAKQEEETVVDFGDGKLFRVYPPDEDDGHFSLVKSTQFQIVKASTDRKQTCRFSFLTAEGTLNAHVLGRLRETFDIADLERKMSQKKETPLAFNQFLDLFACYRSALCSVLDVSVELPFAIGRQGEWTLWGCQKKQRLNTHALPAAFVRDIHRLFHIERLWKINVLGNSPPRFAVSNGHVFVDDILALPTFLRANIHERHESIVKQFRLDSAAQELWDELEKITQEEMIKNAARLEELQGLLDRKILSLSDLVNLHPQARLEEKLLLLRKASEHPEADISSLNYQLQSVLHDAMTKKYSQAFLEDMQHTMANSIGHPRGDN